MTALVPGDDYEALLETYAALTELVQRLRRELRIARDGLQEIVKLVEHPGLWAPDMAMATLRAMGRYGLPETEDSDT